MDDQPVVARTREAELAEKSDAVCRMGAMMLTAGTGSYRVKVAMGRVADALGIERLEAQVSLTDIVVTTRCRGAFRTQVVEVPVPAVNADRIAALMRLSLRAAPGLTPSHLHALLDRLEAQARFHPRGVVVAAATAASAAFAVLNHGSWQACLAAGLAGGCGKGAQVTLGRFRLNPLAIVAVAAMVSCAAGVLLTDLTHRFTAGEPAYMTVLTSAILFLVPGFPLLTAALDLAHLDVVAGLSRLVYATMVSLSAALGAWLVVWGFGLGPAEVHAHALSTPALTLLRAAAGVVGIVGFALTFNTPWRVALVAGLAGATANVARLVAIDAGAHPVVCAGAATLLVGLAAAALSQRLPAPRIILSVPAVLIMIPGADTYRALLATIDSDPLEALGRGFAALATVVALAGGLVAARMLTDPLWSRGKPEWTHMPSTHAQQILRERARGAVAQAGGGAAARPRRRWTGQTRKASAGSSAAER